MAPPKKTMFKGTRHLCAVVTNADGSAVDLTKISSLAAKFRGKYFVPSPTDFLNKSLQQRLYVLDRSQYQKLSGMKVALDEVETFLLEISSDCLITLCINDNEIMHNDQKGSSLSKVFGGPSTPPTEGFSLFYSDLLDLLVSYAVVPSEEVADYMASSTSLCDADFHENVISPGDLKIITRAYCKTGMYNNRLKSQDNGHSTFLGTKTEGSQSNPTPTEGPGMHDRYYLYQLFQNPLFVPSAMTMIHSMANRTYFAGLWLNRPLRILLGADTNQIVGHCRIEILTIDFDTISHVDEQDRLSPTVQLELEERAQIILSETGVCERQLRNYITHIQTMRACVYTTCSYQFVLDKLVKM